MTLRIRLHETEGQGAEAACRMLVAAFSRAGQDVRALAGQPGTPGCADAVLVLDAALFAGVTSDGLAADGLVLVNAPAAPCGRAPTAGRTLAVDASEVARQHGLGSIVSTTMLGAFAGATGLLALDTLATAVAEGSPARPDNNVAACREGYRLGAALATRAVAAP